MLLGAGFNIVLCLFDSSLFSFVFLFFCARVHAVFLPHRLCVGVCLCVWGVLSQASLIEAEIRKRSEHRLDLEEDRRDNRIGRTGLSKAREEGRHHGGCWR